MTKRCCATKQRKTRRSRMHGTIEVAKENMTDQKYRAGEITKCRASQLKTEHRVHDKVDKINN